MAQIKDALTFEPNKNKNTSTTTNNVNEEYYKNLKNESYKALLDSQIQASVARDQALKYTQNALNSNGYGNQGLAESSKVGLMGQYQNALQNANNTYQNSVLNIEQAQREENQSNAQTNANNLLNLLSNSSSTDQLNETMNTYGYLKSDGNLDTTKMVANGLDDATIKNLSATYNLYKSALENSEVELSQEEYINSLSGREVSTDSNKVYCVNNNGKYKTADAKQELSTVKEAFASGTILNGTVVELDLSGTKKAYVKYVDGVLYYSNANEYNKFWNGAKERMVVKNKKLDYVSN